MNILEVVPITKSLNTESLTYFSATPVSAGALVTVPLRKQEITALVIQSKNVVDLKTQLKGANYQIRNITSIHSNSIFSEAFLRMCHELKSFYVTQTGNLIEQITPRVISKNIEHIKRTAATQRQEQQPHTYLLQRSYTDRISYYKTLLRELFLQKKSLHIICPTINETETIFKTLQKNNEQRIFYLHSKRTKKQVFENLEKINNTDYSCIITTPGFVDVFQNNKQHIVIHNSRSEHYRTISKPFIDHRVCIHRYCTYAGLHCTFADTLLPPEQWTLSERNDCDIIEPPSTKIFQPGDITLLTQHTRKPGKQTDKERYDEIKHKKTFNIFHKQSLDIIKEAIHEKKNTFIHSSKKSLAPSIVCSDCGNIAVSPESGFPFSLYIKNNNGKKERIFVCHTTGERMPAFDVCQFCNSWRLTPMGIGTEGIHNQLEKDLDNKSPFELFIIDSKHCTTKKQEKIIMESWSNPDISTIVIGTNKALPILDTIDVSIMTSLDAQFSRMNYAIHSEILDTIINVREKTTGACILQTRNITEKTLPILSDGISTSFTSSELEARKSGNYSPFGNTIKIVQHVKKEYAKRTYRQTHTLFSRYPADIMVYPGNRKNYLRIITVIHQTNTEWNFDSQNPDLLGILYGFNRGVEIFINHPNLT